MITFNVLSIQSFKSIFRLKIDFKNLHKNFYLLEGNNTLSDFASSNGSGKSTIWDALSFALYGTVSGLYVKNEEFQNKNSSLPLKIKLNFDVNINNKTTNYTLIRELKNLELYQDDQNITELTKTETEKKLLNILSLSKDEFFNFTYLTQNGNNFLSKTPAEKLTVLKDFIFGEDLKNIKLKLDASLNIYKDKLNVLKQRISEINGGLSIINKCYNNDVESKEENKTIDELLIEVEHKRTELVSIKKKMKEKSELLSELRIINNELKNFKSKLIKIKSDLKNIKEHVCPFCKQKMQNSSVKEVSKFIDEAKEIKQNAIISSNNKKEIELKLEDYDNLSENTVYELENKIKQLNSRINRITTTKDLSKQQEELKKELTEKETEYNKLDLQRKQLLEVQKYFNSTFIQYIQQALLSEIESYLNLYCYEVFNENFSLDFKNNTLNLYVGGKPYAYFSGGERQRIDLLFIFAVRMTLFNLTDKCTNILVLDESLSGSDSLAYENSVELIDRLSASNNIITILISHKDIGISANKLVISRHRNKTDLNIIET